MKKTLTHIPQLDTLRAFAIILTLMAHWLGDVGLKELPYMNLGVDLFFALSGFLITTILVIASKGDVLESKITIVKNFIIRRALRLFPIYYIFLIFFVLLSFTGFWIWKEGYGIYYFTYTENFLFFLKGHQNTLFNHFWSLCVEEQFYLLWPWFIIYLPLKRIPLVIYVIIFIGVISNFWFNPASIRVMLNANLHTLGIGALLAFHYYKFRDNTSFMSMMKQSRTIFALTFICLVSLLITELYIDLPKILEVLINQVLFIVVLYFLILATLFGWSGLSGKLFDNGMLQYLGKISYGIYLFHRAVPILVKLFFSKVHMAMPSPFLSLILFSAITLAVSSLSYKFIETPFLKLKSKFK